MAATGYQWNWHPWGCQHGESSTGVNSFALDATNDGVGFALQANSTNAITHIGYRYGARAGTPPTYIIGLEGVSAGTGAPDGTYKQNGGNNCTATFTPPADATWDSTWRWAALDYSYTPTIGEILAATIRYSSGTVSGVNSSSIAYYTAQFGSGHTRSWPSVLRLNAGTWSKQGSTPIGGFRTASERYGLPYQTTWTTTTAATVGHRAALKFTIPAGCGDTFTLAGMSLVKKFNNNSATATYGLWNAAGTTLASAEWDGDYGVSATGGDVVMFTARPTLSCGTTYYIGLEVAGASSGVVTLYGMQCAEADDLQCFAGGTGWCYSGWNGSSWTDTTTVRPYATLIFDDFTEPSAGGGLIVHPGMSGGMRG